MMDPTSWWGGVRPHDDDGQHYFFHTDAAVIGARHHAREGNTVVKLSSEEGTPADAAESWPASGIQKYARWFSLQYHSLPS